LLKLVKLLIETVIPNLTKNIVQFVYNLRVENINPDAEIKCADNVEL